MLERHTAAVQHFCEYSRRARGKCCLVVGRVSQQHSQRAGSLHARRHAAAARGRAQALHKAGNVAGIHRGCHAVIEV